MTVVEVKAAIDAHARWLAGSPEGARADLSGADLSGADLRSANLSEANLSGANLYRACLSGAYLSGANLSAADLSGADLRRTDLSGANLSGANLSEADLRRADLSGANLSEAYLSAADLSGADLSGATQIDPLCAARLELVPREGPVVGWKRCAARVLVKLLVPADARRSNATGRKCRAEWVEVLEVIGAEAGTSMHDGATQYRPGETVRCHEWNPDRWVECGGGIHFYMTREECEAH